MYHKIKEVDKKIDLVLAKLKLIDKAQKVVKEEIKEEEKKSGWIFWPFIRRKDSVFREKEETKSEEKKEDKIKKKDKKK